MKIGLLAYHSVCNFGATLQLLSTYMYLIKHGHTPIIINWVPKDLEDFYARNTPYEQQNLQIELRKKIWKETNLCRTSKDIAETIKKEKIEAVIIGSDAVAQHHPLAERIIFPCKKIITIDKLTSDRYFPNPFWGTWNKYLPSPIPIAFMSVSSQDSHYKYISESMRKEMFEQIKTFSYISTRDKWTHNMISFITNRKYICKITPDPVFAFQENAEDLIPSKNYIMKKYNLPEKYIILSFLCNYINNDWIAEFSHIAKGKGYKCILLPFSHKESYGVLPQKIKLPISPIDWYAIIRYSSGYIGNNMHPIVVSIHNSIPFFSFDNYGVRKLFFRSDKSSKIKDLLRIANLQNNRISCINTFFRAPSPNEVFLKIQSFNTKISEQFSRYYIALYYEMMENILKNFSKKQ